MMWMNWHVGWDHVRTLDNVWRVFGTDRAARPWRHTWRLWLREAITTSINKHSYSTAINERLQTKRDISAIRVSQCFQTHLLLWKLWRHSRSGIFCWEETHNADMKQSDRRYYWWPILNFHFFRSHFFASSSHPKDWTPFLLDLMKKSFLPCLVTSIHPPSLSMTPACSPALHTLDCWNKRGHYSH